MAVTSVIASFSISGAAIAEHARALMEQGDWREAMDYLRDTLQGMTYEQAVSILEGQYGLTGSDNSITMFEEDASVAQTLGELYAQVYGNGGHVKVEGRMYEAYMVVDNLGWADCEPFYEMAEIKNGQRLNSDWIFENDTVDVKSTCPKLYPWTLLQLRARHYAEDPTNDISRVFETLEGRRVCVLFQLTTRGTTPFWRERECADLEKAFRQVEKYLPVTGYAQHFGVPHPSSRVRETPVRQAPVVSPERDRDLAQLETEEMARVQQHLDECEAVRKKIVEFADADQEYGWFEYKWKPTTPETHAVTLRAPYRALLNYALSTTTSFHLAPKYEAFSPSGLKMCEDNPYHTDVWLGCGLRVDAETYNHKTSEFCAVLDMMFEIQKKLLNFEVQVLARGPQLNGRVVFHDTPDIDATCVLVIPNAGVDYELQAMKAGAVISEVGGRLAHLVTVCREQGKAIIRMDGALTKLRVGQYVTVNPDIGKVDISPISHRAYGSTL